MKNTSLIEPLVLAVCIVLAPVAFCGRAHGAAGEVDLSFDPGSGVDGALSAMAVQPDGKVLIAGDFTTVKGLARNRVARLNPDGSGDATFEVDVPADQWGNLTWGPAYALALQPDGKVLVGKGAWVGVPTVAILRLNSDGSVDQTFSVGEEWYSDDGGVYSIAVQPDGRILIGGSFSKVNGTARNGIARLNSDGSVDRTFYAGSLLGSAHPLALQPDGKVLVNGLFTVSGVNRFALVRLHANGTLDGSFNALEATDDALTSIVLQPDGRVLLGGGNVCRLNADGSLDGSFGADGRGIGAAPIALQPDGKVLVSGGPDIVRLNANGSPDAGFSANMGENASVQALILQPDGRVLVAGDLLTGNGASRMSLARLNGNGSRDGSFQPGTPIDDRVSTLVLQLDGKVLIGGSFKSVHGFRRMGIARLNSDGSLDQSFDPAIKFFFTASYIRSISVQPDGKIIITGSFATQDENGMHSLTVARLNADGTVDGSFQPDLTVFIPPFDPPFGWRVVISSDAGRAVTQPDGNIIISGFAATNAFGIEDGEYLYGGQPFLARFHPDSSLDNSFHLAPGILFGDVQRMILQPDGKLLVCGRIVVNGAYRGITRLNGDGSLDTTFNPGIWIAGSYVFSMGLQADGKVLLGGLSSWIMRFTARHENAIVRLNADGSVDDTFNPPTGISDSSESVYSLAIQPDGKVITAGLNLAINGSYSHAIVRLNTDGSLDTGFHDPGRTRLILAAALQPDGNVLIGGDFHTVDGEARLHVARLLGDSPAPSLSIAVVNGSAVLSWPVTAVTYQLRETADFSQPGSWSPTPQNPVAAGGLLSVSVPFTGERKFFRLAPPQSVQ